MKVNLRILIVSQQYRPVIGGYERAAERLATGLAAEGHDVTVVTERRDPQWPAQEGGHGFAVRRLWCIYRPRWHLVTSVLSLTFFLLLNARRFQVLHIQQYGTYAAGAIAMARLFSIPVILRTTNTKSAGIAQTLGGTSLFSRWVAALHRKADACIVTTEWALEEVVRFGLPRDRIRLIPNGIDIDEMKPDAAARAEARARLIPSGDWVVALYCGRLDEAKNPLGLIRAWKAVASTSATALLVMVGDGPQRAQVRELVDREGLNGCVLLAGAQSAVLPWYRAADVFILPSHFEGLSNSLLEAMSCGLPVVSTKVSGSVDIFARCDIGALVEVDDEAGLAAAVGQLMAAPARRAACGADARHYAEQNFSIQAVTRQVADLYREVINSAGQAR